MGNYRDGRKPALISSFATYNQALAKLDAIITYCGSAYAEIKGEAEAMKTKLMSDYSSGSWSAVSVEYLEAIMGLIYGLDSADARSRHG